MTLHPKKKYILFAVKVLKPTKFQKKVLKPIRRIIEDILLEKYGFIHIFFNKTDQHFTTKYFDKTEKKYSEDKNMWALSFIKALSSALTKLEKMKGVITSGRAIAPKEED